MASSRFRFLRAGVLLCAFLLMAACGNDPQAGDDSVADAGGDATEAPSGNLREGCVDDPDPSADYFPDKAEVEHAESFRVSYEGTYKTVEVSPPDIADPVRYVLVQCGTEPPALEGDLAGASVVEVPVSSVVTLTTTNLPHFDELDAVDRIVGVGTGAFVTTESVLERVRAGELEDYADAAGQPDLERLIATDPDLLIIDGFGDTLVDDVGRFTEAGIPTAVNADFNETSLLGRAEWMKFTSLFLNSESAATERFDEIAAEYEAVAAQAAEAAEAGGRPSAFANMPFEGTWFLPGGASFFASAVAEAGGEYAFADDDSTASLSLDIETVLERAGDADVWLQAGSVNGTLDDLAAVDERFEQFRAFQEGQVWANDVLVTEEGGYAVFELAYTRADLFLTDLAKIFHPEAFADRDHTFLGQVPDEPAGG